jgi:dATP pyrophosphohydrolase
MARRLPVNVLVFPFRKNGSGEYEFAVFKRAVEGFWQGISGGVDEGEDYAFSARREAQEEAGIPLTEKLYKLNSVTSVPAHLYKASEEWGPAVYVIPQYYYAMEVTKPQLVISSEHTEYKWTSFDEATELLFWHSDKVGLQELNCRLLNDDLELA